MRKLAYEIHQRTEADYRFFRFEGEKPLLDELNHNLKITDGVLRFRIFKVDPRSPVIDAARRRCRAGELGSARAAARSAARRRAERRPTREAPGRRRGAAAPVPEPAEAPSAEAPGSRAEPEAPAEAAEPEQPSPPSSLSRGADPQLPRAFASHGGRERAAPRLRLNDESSKSERG